MTALHHRSLRIKLRAIGNLTTLSVSKAFAKCATEVHKANS
uniref:Uncharacterized protein n=1 Tax=Rhizophora mucronata TaxID=61149 RepID=A0A2P2NRJ2_RHIMU